MHEDGRRRDDERGYMLVVMIFSVVLLTLFSLGFIGEGLADRATLNRYETSMRALEIAETGLARAEMELAGGLDPEGDGLGTLTGAFAGGTYDVAAVQDTADPSLWILTATGTHGLSVRRIETGVRVAADLRFPRAIFGRDRVVIQSHGATDAYDSGLGTYASQVVNVDARGPYAGLGADVASNGPIELQGGDAAVRGDATPGPLDTVAISAPAWVVGSTTPAPEEFNMPDPPLADFQAAFAVNDNGGLDVSDPQVEYDPAGLTMLVKNGSELVLPAGTYFFQELSLLGGSTLRVTGAVEIYVTNTMDLSGGSVANQPGTPADLLVHAHPYPLPGTSVKSPGITTSGGATSVMAIYAPGIDVTVKGGSDFFGAIVGRVVTVQGSAQVHYDRALGSINGPYGVETARRLYWVDRMPPP
jgi:hypothetical protein